MDQLLKDLETLYEDWDVWSTLNVDREKNEVSIQRSDEDQLVVTIQVSPTYPKGKTVLVDSFERTYKPDAGVTILDALDEALSTWEDADGDAAMGGARGSSVLFEQAQGTGGGGGGGGVEIAVNDSVLEQIKVRIAADARDSHIAKNVKIWYEVGRRRHVVRYFLPLSDYLDKFRAKALHLDRNKALCVEFAWPWMYLDATDVPEIRDVYLIDRSDRDAEAPKSIDHQVGALKWFFMDRIKSAMTKNHIHRDRKRMGISDNEVYEDQETEKGKGLSEFRYTFPEEDFYIHGNENILVGLFNVIAYRLHTCTERCVICDSALELQCMKMSVCEKDLCVHSSETYGLGSEVLSELSRNPEICDLLLSLTYYAVCSGNSRDTFTPMCPTLLMRENYPGYDGPLHFYKGQFGQSEQGKNFDLMRKVMNDIPSVSRMVSMAKGDPQVLRDLLQAKNPLIFPFVRWVFSSNRVHVEPIEKRLHMKGLGTHQFHLISSNPAKEAKFRRLRDAAKKRTGKGSIWVWHGSQPGNWHCILRLGLKNYSNTKFMSAGAAYGPGIYTATNISTSLGYMGQPNGSWPNAEFMSARSGATLISLCELVNAENKQGLVNHGGIITVQNEDLICTRFLFAFPDGFNGDNSLLGDNVNISKELLEMIE